MKKSSTLKKFIKILSVIILIYFLFVLIVTTLYSGVLQNCTDEKYWEEIRAKKGIIHLGDIFDEFEWTKIYIVENQKLTSGEIDDKLSINCNAGTLDYDWFEYKYANRVLFINNDECVYDFVYDERRIKFNNLGDIIEYDDAIYEVDKQMFKSVFKLRKESF